MNKLIDKIQRQLDANHYVEAENIQKLIDGYKTLVDECWDLRCESQSMADTGDYHVYWSVYEHHMRGESKLVASANNPLEAINKAKNKA